jgi:hypothetical protein
MNTRMLGSSASRRMHLRAVALGGLFDLRELSLVIKGVLLQRGRAGFLQEEHQRSADAGVDRGVELQEKSGDEREPEHEGVGAGGTAHNINLGRLTKSDGDHHEVGGDGGDGQVS